MDHYVILAILVQERLLKSKLAQGRASKVMVRMGTLFGERRQKELFATGCKCVFGT